MTVVVIIFLPLVLVYQTWTYYVFRRRVSQDAEPASTSPSRQAPGAQRIARRGGCTPGPGRDLIRTIHQEE